MNVAGDAPKMVLGVGAAEVALLEARFAEFAPYFPALRLLRRDAIAQWEPNVVAGRDPDEPIVALASTDGYIVNYGRLAESFLRDATMHAACDTYFHTSVHRIERSGGEFIVHMDGGDLRARAVAVTAGGHSLLFAKQMGYGTDLEILPVAGSFFRSKIRQCLRGKVYTVQQPGRPFAATHGDPEVTNPDETRFGPTAKPIPYLERHKPGTILDFLRTVVWNARGLLAYLAILADRTMLAFALRNICMDLPFIGVRLFLRDVRKIVPTMRARDLVRARGVGGVRPQLVDTRTRAMLFGDGRLIGDRITFRITPSPGATACLRSAAEDAETLCDFLGAQFDRECFMRDHARTAGDSRATAS